MRRFMAAFAALLLLHAQAFAAEAPKTGLTRLLEAELGRFAGPGGPYTAGIYVKHLPSGEVATVKPDTHFNSASVIKLAVLVLAYRMADAHKLNLNERYEVKAGDFRSGSGIFRYNDEGLKPTLRDVLTQMVITSDNGATDIMIGKVGGVDAVNAFLKEQGYGILKLNHTLYEGNRARFVMLDPMYKSLTPEQVFALTGNLPWLTAKHKTLIDEIQKKTDASSDINARMVKYGEQEGNWLGVIAPVEMGGLLEGIEQGTIASKESCEEMKRMMRAQQSGTRKIPHYLSVPVAHKTGEVGGVTNDVGMIYAKSGTILIAFMTMGYTGLAADADDRLGAVARLVVEYFDGAP